MGFFGKTYESNIQCYSSWLRQHNMGLLGVLILRTFRNDFKVWNYTAKYFYQPPDWSWTTSRPPSTSPFYSFVEIVYLYYIFVTHRLATSARIFCRTHPKFHHRGFVYHHRDPKKSLKKSRKFGPANGGLRQSGVVQGHLGPPGINISGKVIEWDWSNDCSAW